MTEKLFETALGISAPWYVAGADFNAQARTLTIRVDFAQGSRFAPPGVDGEDRARGRRRVERQRGQPQDYRMTKSNYGAPGRRARRLRISDSSSRAGSPAHCAGRAAKRAP